MKNLLLFLIFFYPGFNLQAQEIDIIESPLLVEGKSTNALIVTLDGDQDFLKKKWQDYAKSKLKIKLRNNSGIQFAEKITLFQVTDKRADLYSIVYPEAGRLKMGIVFAPGYDIYLTSQDFPVEFERFRTQVLKFSLFYYGKFYEQAIKDKKSTKRKLESDKKNTDREIASLKKKMAKITTSESDTTAEGARLFLEKNSHQQRIDELNGISSNLIVEIGKTNTAINEAKANLIQVKRKIK